ncbi:Zinc finger c2hc domain-containing protein 1c, partial [Globisporangium splendens]
MHFKECQVQTFHKQNQTELYKKFEEMLCLMSEDTTLRSLHYASSFPDVKPLAVSASSLENYKAQTSSSDHGSIQDSLFLLRRWRRHSDIQNTEEAARTGSEYKEDVRRITSGTQQPRRTLQRASSAASVSSSESTSTTSSRRKTSADSANDVVGTNRSRKQPVGYTYQESETCRYCGRSFAEGRLAKHEAVCPRVFGNEGSWGRGTSTTSHVSPTTPRSMSTSPFAKRPGVQSKKKTFKSTPIEKRNLELSYKEHQATLVGCPVCKRKFAPSGAQQHIAICKSVQNRPKNPIPLFKDYAIAG